MPSASNDDARDHLAWIIASGGTGDPVEQADSLLAEFGTLGSVLAASPARLRRATGDGSVVAQIIRFKSATRHVLHARIADRPLLSCWSQVVDYLRFDLGFSALERFRLLHLDAQNRLMRDQLLSEGSATRAPVSVRTILGDAMDMGAASLILVHNHPAGDPTPSPTDIELTGRIVDLARGLEIEVIDHLIVGATSVYSFRRAGLLA